jgi:hypothetical protein
MTSLLHAALVVESRSRGVRTRELRSSVVFLHPERGGTASTHHSDAPRFAGEYVPSVAVMSDVPFVPELVLRHAQRIRELGQRLGADVFFA